MGQLASAYHWCNEKPMETVAVKIFVPLVCEQRKCLHLELTHTAFVIFDGFRGKNTPEFFSLLDRHNSSCIQVPPKCRDKLQPLDISINKVMKSALRKHIQSCYANEVMTHFLMTLHSINCKLTCVHL